MSDFGRLLDEALDDGRDPRSAAPAPLDPVLAAIEGAVADLHVRGVEIAPGLRAAVEELGLELPCSARDIVRAFRRLAFKTHPDRPGGSHEAFLRAQGLLEEALASLHARTGAVQSASLARFRAQPVRSTGHSVYA